MKTSRPQPPLGTGAPPRRAVLAGAAGLVLAWLTPIRDAVAAQDPTIAPGDLLVRVGDDNLIPLTPDDIPFDGRALHAWPIGPTADAAKDGTPLNRVVVARLNPATLSEATASRAVDDIVAYSAICTHSGCEVDDSLGDNSTFFCSCHGSTFDPRDSGAAIGGPAPRALPALPLKLESGRLVVAGRFTMPPGFGR
ncbi:MAG: Rieske (2Fe-2S) protein [Vicinamibacterales bacterium]